MEEVVGCAYVNYGILGVSHEPINFFFPSKQGSFIGQTKILYQVSSKAVFFSGVYLNTLQLQTNRQTEMYKSTQKVILSQ